jgi:L-alanine-DL-glutamate epimerase-like enolase superfamily enzyme
MRLLRVVAMLIEKSIARIEHWPLAAPFKISRGAKTQASIITVELTASGITGRGECCPYPRYGETVAAIKAELDNFDPTKISASDFAGARHALQHVLAPGSARNALDCALWDLEAKTTGTPVWRLVGLPTPAPAATCFTISLDTPEAMATEARRHPDCPLLKLKLGDPPRDGDRIRAVRDARPDTRLVCDANEGWQADDLRCLLEIARSCGIELIEQPLPAGDDRKLAGLCPEVPLCADESAAPGTSISPLAGRYQAVNIKLDKTGGLTAAIAAIDEARRLGLKIMVGSMVSTSLSMAPAALLAPLADWVDLDSPLLLAADRPHGMLINDGMLSTPSRELWG